jgi:hypothetical protein
MKDHFLIMVFMLFALMLDAQCFPDRHNTSQSSAWISCDTSPNPNVQRGDSHWIRYNLNTTYSLGPITFWNYNHPEDLDRGLQEIIIDYSVDGIEWIEWGTFTLDQAAGSAFYEGDQGPDLGGLVAKDILITAVSNYGDANCFALSEIKIDVLEVVSSTDNPTVDIELSLSPNPTSDYLTLSIDDLSDIKEFSYSLINLDGKIFSTERLNVSGQKLEKRINVRALPAGMYLLELRTETGNISKPFSIIR